MGEDAGWSLRYRVQPLSPDLQPPLPLQEFLPLQACFSLGVETSFLPWSWDEMDGLEVLGDTGAA